MVEGVCRWDLKPHLQTLHKITDTGGTYSNTIIRMKGYIDIT